MARGFLISVVEGVNRFIVRTDEGRVGVHGAPKIKQFDGVRGFDDLNVQKREVTMTEFVCVQVRQAIQKLIMKIDFLLRRDLRSFAYDIVKRPSINVLEHHADVLETPQESSDVTVTRKGGVYAQFC